MTKFTNGHPQRIWVKTKGKRNEALDCRVYGLAALHILNPNLEMLAEQQIKESMNITKKEPKSYNKAQQDYNRRIRESYQNPGNWINPSDEWLNSGFEPRY
jgi:phage terminase large subunit GpA-like protein